MSADNWTYCYRCVRRYREAADDIKRIADESYGKVAPEEYARLLAKAQEPGQPEQTLREDYDIGITEDSFYVTYSARCTECGFSYKYTNTINVGTAVSGENMDNDSRAGREGEIPC